MEYVYLLLNELGSWEDLIIILSEKEAVDLSIKYPKSRVEIFGKINNFGYQPTYNYYKNGVLITY